MKYDDIETKSKDAIMGILYKGDFYIPYDDSTEDSIKLVGMKIRQFGNVYLIVNAGILAPEKLGVTILYADKTENISYQELFYNYWEINADGSSIPCGKIYLKLEKSK